MKVENTEQTDSAVVDAPPSDEHVGLFHIYPKWPTRPGDRALCGHIKRGGGRVTRYGDHPDLCVVCNELYDRHGSEQ